MITDKKLLPKLESIEKRYIPYCFERVAAVPVEMTETVEHFRQEPAEETQLEWKVVKALSDCGFVSREALAADIVREANGRRVHWSKPNLGFMI